MEPEWMVMRVAYMVLFITLALMAWAYMVQAEAMAEPLVAEPLWAKGHQGNVLDTYPPCSFNPLCTCSKPGPTEFGIVACHDVPFGNIPLTLNFSRAFLLSMVGNNIQVLDDKRLVGSGLWRLEIKENNLNYIADDAFIGVSKFLSELDLQCNQLTTIPTAALKRLAKPAKLKILDLGYNLITDVYPDDLESLPSSITRLGLSGNMLTYIQEDAFASLRNLERIDLFDNSIQFIHNQAFTSLSKSLKFLNLNNNLFQKVPFQSLSTLQLKELDLSHNLLTQTFDIFFDKKLTVGVLNLNYNRISSLPPYAFQNFREASRASLAYNPIDSLVDDAFKDAKIYELDLSHCFIKDVQPKAFRGLENTLESLDLSFNNISHLPFELFENFDSLRHLNLDENRLQVTHDELDNFRLFTLYRFSIVGDKMSPFSMEDIELMRNLRSLNLSNFGMASLTPQVFDGFGLAVEDIRISHGKLATVKADAFSPLTGLKSIDLSENKIERIDDLAFQGVEHSLLRLKMNNAIRIGTLPSKAFQKLSALRFLDLSSNGLNKLPEDTFAESKRLLYLNLRFNKISSLSRVMFECTKLPKIQRILLSFNNIKEVKESTFARLTDLEFIELNENIIETIHTRAFEDLTNLRILNLAGNKISILKDEAFQNLPRLQVLDLSYNKLTSINLDAFEQLGTLSSFRIYLNHNNIQRLITSTDDSLTHESNLSGDDEESEEADIVPHPILSSISSSSIEAIDLSFNNISFISPHFFFPISSTLIELDLSHNRLQNLTLEHLSGMRFIQYLKLDHNGLDTIEYNTFRETKFIQFINLNQNLLRDIPPDLFENCLNLRVLSATDNKIRALTDSIFKDTQIEILNVANNQLVRFPENALAKVASTLVQLDLSGNEISSLAPNQVECLQNLRTINLSNNRVVVIAESTFDNLHSLLHLDLSGNHLGKLSARLFEGMKETLLHLNIANTSLETLPELKFSKLLTLNASFNRLINLPTNFGVNVSSLRTLDISGNEISTPPNTIWHTIPRLSQVSLSQNPIRTLTNDSFLQLDRLQSLDITDLPLDSVQVGVFTPLVCLKKLSIGPVESSISLGLIIQAVKSLQDLHLKLDVPTMTSELNSYPLPEKVSTIALSGEELLSISAGAFDGVRGRQLKLIIDEGTGLIDLPGYILQQLGDATQLSLKISNSALKTISNPNSQFRKEAFVTYLESLELDESIDLSCSCETGWIEFWVRQWMERACPIGSVTPKDGRCNKMWEMLRNVNCHNKPGTDLMQAFVTDLECGWESSASSLWSHIKSFRYTLNFSLFSSFLVSFWVLRI